MTLILHNKALFAHLEHKILFKVMLVNIFNLVCVQIRTESIKN